MIVTDLRPFKTDLHALIDAVDTTQDGWPEKLRADVLELVRRHGAFLNARAPEFAEQILKLVQANNRPRAKKLIDVLEDKDFTKGGIVLTKILTLLMKLGLLALLMFLVVCGYHQCSGTAP